MKKKIILGLSLFALIFLTGGVYIITTTKANIYDLHRLSQLHHAVSARRDLMQSVRKNQDDIVFRSRRLAMEELTGGKGMTKIIGECYECHHSASPSREQVAALERQIGRYAELTRLLFAASPGSALSLQRANEALREGDDLTRKLAQIITATEARLANQERDLLRTINKKKNILFTLVMVGPFLLVVLAFFLIRGITEPVNSLLEATRRIKTGELDHRVEGLKGEFGELAESFNEMAVSLKRQMQEMQRSDQLKVCGEISAGLAHEIRNPLAGMKVSIEVLLAELSLEEEDRDVLIKVLEQIRHIELLMKSLLNFTRPAKPRPESVDVNGLLEQTTYFVEKYPEFASENPRKKIVRNLEESLPDIRGDFRQLQQVFLNLLLNAAEAIPEQGEITLATRYNRSDKTITVTISDTGKGIPEPDMERLFQPFFTTKRKGTGLGLAVSKRIVEEHDGSIEALNLTSGGAMFVVRLPVWQGEERRAAS